MTKLCLTEFASTVVVVVSGCTRSTPPSIHIRHTSDVIRVVNIIVVSNYSHMNGSVDGWIMKGKPFSSLLDTGILGHPSGYYMDGLFASVSK
jgi:hypothetical protein